MTREQALERAVDYAYGDLSPADAAEFERLLRDDPDVRRELEGSLRVRREAAGLERKTIPGKVRRDLLAIADREARRRAQAERPAAPRWGARFPAYLAAAAVLVVAGVGVQRAVQRVMERPEDRGAVTPGDGTTGGGTIGQPDGSAAAKPQPDSGAASGTPDAASLLGMARAARTAGRLDDALEACRKALASPPRDDLLADVLAEAAELARALGNDDEASGYLDRLERLPGGAARAAAIRAQPAQNRP